MIITMKVTTFRLKGNFHTGAGQGLLLLIIHLEGCLLDWSITTLPGLGLSLNQGMGTHHPVDISLPL